MVSLLAYDGKPYTEKALDYAIRHSLAYDSVLFIMSSVTSKDAIDKENELANIKVYLDEAKYKANRSGVDARTLIGAGHPADEILAAADRVEADTIIVGHTDKTAIDRVIWGTVSEHVLRNAHCTVIVVQ